LTASRIKGIMDKDLRAVLKAAVEQGWRVEETKKGWMLRSPDPAQGTVAIHKTPSDVRAIYKTIAQLRRRGLRWPPT
jgi:hypothetical protein